MNVPLVTEVLPVIVAPPPKVANPPILKIPVSDAFPIVRVPIYALAVLIAVVDIPLLAVNRPPIPSVPVLLKFPLFEILVNDPPLPDTRTPVNPDPSPVNFPLKLPYPAVVENVDIYALILLIVVVDKPPCRVVKLAPVTPNVPATDVTPVIEAPPVVTVSVLEIVAVPALLKLPEAIFRPPPPVINPPTLKIPVSDAFPIVRVPIYAEAVLIVVVDKPPCRVVKLAPVTPKVPATVVAPVIEAPPVVTVSVLEIVAVPALLKLPEAIFRPPEPVINPPKPHKYE